MKKSKDLRDKSEDKVPVKQKKRLSKKFMPFEKPKTEAEKTLDEMLKKKMDQMEDMQENLKKFKEQADLASKHKFPLRKDFDTDQEYLNTIKILAVE